MATSMDRALEAFESETAKLDKLLDRKHELLKKQAETAREFNSWLTVKGEGNAAEDGAIENSKKVVKNLEAAIVQARQPGYFEYHKRSRRVHEMEAKQELKKLASQICKMEEQLTAVSAEIDAIYEERKKALEEFKPPTVTGLSDWFARYGEPSSNMKQISGLASEFVANPKVYGGTSHHKAFKTLAVTLKRGRLTR